MPNKKDMTAGLAPVHPGAFLREDVLPAIRTSKVEVARALGISRAQLYAILSERAAVTAPMALRLGRFFGNGPELWLNMQSNYDLEILGRSMAREIARIPTVKAA
jgi:addiction module HigA family antidote